MTKASRILSMPSSELILLSQDGVDLPFEPGDIVCGKYQIIGLIGTGGMGFVVSALHIELHEVVALKFLRPEALANPEVVARFATEARASVRIKSEHVARVFDVGALPSGEPFMVMEHLEGKDLGDHLREHGPLSVKVAVEYVIEACEALAAAHSVGVVHRDIKPENLFLTQRAQGMHLIKVLDFGISKVALTGSAFDTGLPLVRTMMPMGSPVYMSPEQIRGSEDIDGRTDIWSLGCVLYELLTGVAAFDAPSLTQLSATILEKDPVPMADLAAEIPAELVAVIMRCLSKDANQRFQNIAELAMALYPFGPRRARVSVERCAVLLEGAAGAAKFDLLSVRPPPHSSDALGLMGNGGVMSPVSATLRESPRTTTPAAISVRDPLSPPTLRENGRWIAAAGIFAVALGLGGYAMMRAPASHASAASSGVVKDVISQPAEARGRVVAPRVEPQVGASKAAPAVAEGTPTPGTVATAEVVSRVTAAPVGVKAPSTIGHAKVRRVVAAPGDHKSSSAHASDDADVGF